VAHNFDWRPGTFAELFGAPGMPNDRKICSRNFVMELYPSDGGYASIGIGSMDLINGIFGGMNEHGLLVSVLVDKNCPKNMDLKKLDESCGLTSITLVRLLLDTCATVDEAKTTLMLNKMIFIFEGVHFLVCDTTGKSVICEMDPLLFQWHFTDNNNELQIMTNHACYLQPDSNAGASPKGDGSSRLRQGYGAQASSPLILSLSKGPRARLVTAQDPYDSFNRYGKLYGFIKSHNGKFSLDNAKESMQLVFGHGMKNEKKIRFRTLFTELYDVTDKTRESMLWFFQKHLNLNWKGIS
jgi:hypothetical protein